jgi:hypothetical protein
MHDCWIANTLEPRDRVLERRIQAQRVYHETDGRCKDYLSLE